MKRKPKVGEVWCDRDGMAHLVVRVRTGLNYDTTIYTEYGLQNDDGFWDEISIGDRDVNKGDFRHVGQL